MPIKHLVINCRKSPCGEGSKTWDRLEMKIYKRVIDFICNPQDIKEITSIKIDPGVEVELALQQDWEKGQFVYVEWNNFFLTFFA